MNLYWNKGNTDSESDGERERWSKRDGERVMERE